MDNFNYRGSLDTMLMRVKNFAESNDAHIENPSVDSLKQLLQDTNDMVACQKTLSNLLVIWDKGDLFPDDDDLPEVT
jgi:hypothetical protein